MPVRRQVVSRLSEKIRGVHVFYRGESDTITDAQLAQTEQAADDAFVWFAQAVDWSRINLESTGIHMARQRSDENHTAPFGDATCGECILLALLNTERGYAEWDSSFNEYSKSDDWVLDMAKGINYRTDRTYRLMRRR